MHRGRDDQNMTDGQPQPGPTRGAAIGCSNSLPRRRPSTVIMNEGRTGLEADCRCDSRRGDAWEEVLEKQTRCAAGVQCAQASPGLQVILGPGGAEI